MPASDTSPVPRTFALPDLSALDDHLLANLNLSMSIGRGFPPSNAQHLVTAFTRATETSLRMYERARVELVAAGAEDRLQGFMRGCSDLELTVIALNRAMRLGRALKESPETRIANSDLPPKDAQARLTEMRNAVDHSDDPIIKGEAGIGLALSLEVRDSILSINRRGTPVVISQDEFGEWIRSLQALVVALTNEPEHWRRGLASNPGVSSHLRSNG